MPRPLAFLLAFLLASAPLATPAQSDSGQITITVIDGATEQPLSNARVFLTGATTASSLTAQSGIVKYLDVPVGIYRVRIGKGGYQGAASGEFEVLGGKSVKLSVALSQTQNTKASGLRVIGAEVVRASNIEISTNDISDESPIRRLSDSLSDALDKLAGVTVNQDSNDPNSAVTISLNGHDESQTGVTLDGIPLSAPGVATNLRNVNTDLFSGARASFGPSAGSLGGSVNFRTLEPTQSWQEHLAAQYGTYDHANYQVAATGSLGPLGIAVQHTWRGANNPLTFQDYQDSSGLTYPHGGFSTSLGDSLKLRYRLGDRATVTGTLLDSNSAISLLCTRDVTVLPCGAGPGNNQFGKYLFGYGTLSSLVGNVAFTATAFSSANTNTTDELNRYIAGVSSPYATSSTSNTRGYALSATVAQNKHTFSLTGNTFTSVSAFTPTVTSSQYVLPSSTGFSARQAQFGDSIKSNDKLSLSWNLSAANTTGVGSSVLAGGGATWRPTGSDTYTGSIAIGSSQPGTTQPRSLSDPVSARFDCSGGSTVVSGPGDSPQSQSSISYDLTYTHQWRYGQITADAFRQTQGGQTIGALINAASEPAGYLPFGYIGQLQNAWAQPTVCGGIPFDPTQIYVNQPVSGSTRMYQGVNVSGRIGIGPNVVLLPTYSINQAVLLAADSRLAGALSTTVIGQQLPGRPLHRAGLTIDGVMPHNGFEFLANAQYTGTNNNRYLRPYTVASFGISHAVGGYGRLTAFVNNAFNTEAGDFTNLQFAQPVPVSGGGAVLFPASPLTPRQFTIGYSVNVGRGSRPVASTLQQAAQQGGRDGGGPGGRGPGGPGGPRFQRNVLPPGGDPLALATTNPACDKDAQAIAQPIVDAFRAYVTAYETHAALPAMPAGFTVAPHPITGGNAGTYWLEIRPDAGAFGGPGGPGGPGGAGRTAARGGVVTVDGVQQAQASPAPSPSPAGSAEPSPSASGAPGNGQRRQGQGASRFRAIFACTYFTPLTQEEAAAKGITITSGRLPLGYLPGVGFFGVQPKQLPQGGGSVR